MLIENGEVHITHKTGHPFIEWKIEDLAIKVGLRLVDEALFCKADYPGYHNKKGDRRRCNRTFHVGKCSTYKFGLLRTVRNGN
ncbi:hypothetical protein GIB67_002653 [Kingdonia uniflora]|uniref:25S rRNA (uridine-N(3))-methyltransferase BMT5-like domain-containing protein n=1 Tax=Kingdonia uniflora TaxID=39325 RepID=A0A7J7LJQ3_9MAGN|nr:hypothetical protein GIB67_002653 [Kingdonia uniflora]